MPASHSVQWRQLSCEATRAERGSGASWSCRRLDRLQRCRSRGVVIEHTGRLLLSRLLRSRLLRVYRILRRERVPSGVARLPIMCLERLMALITLRQCWRGLHCVVVG
jgi:hypothetical protein